MSMPAAKNPLGTEENALMYRDYVVMNPYELAELWASDPLRRWHGLNGTVTDLAMTSALVTWLSRWIPIVVHGAVLGGADGELITAATGTPLPVIARQWQGWAQAQRDLYTSDNRFGVPPQEYERVAAALGLNGTTPTTTPTAERGVSGNDDRTGRGSRHGSGSGQVAR